MKVLVTGGTGFIGSHLVDRLLEQGDEVHCLIRDGVRWIDPDRVRLYDELPSDLRVYDTIYHIAGVLGRKGIPLSRYEEAHIKMPSRIMARMNGTQIFVYTSTAWVEFPQKPYEMTKVTGEKIVRESGLNWRIVRPGFTYGPRDFHHLPIFKWIQKLGRGFPIVGSGKNIVCPTYIDDVVDGLLQCRKMKPVITIAGAPITMQGFLNAIAGAVGKPRPVVHIPPVIRGNFFTKERNFKTDLQPTDLHKGLAITVSWYKERGLL